MVCWKGAIALVVGIVLGLAGAFEFQSGEQIAMLGFALAVAGGFLIILGIYWFTRPPCENEDQG